MDGIMACMTFYPKACGSLRVRHKAMKTCATDLFLHVENLSLYLFIYLF